VGVVSLTVRDAERKMTMMTMMTINLVALNCSHRAALGIDWTLSLAQVVGLPMGGVRPSGGGVMYEAALFCVLFRCGVGFKVGHVIAGAVMVHLSLHYVAISQPPGLRV
jgi:hypothetical protein